MKLARSLWLEAALALVAAGWILSGVASVPFHPDETSLLFQSRDLEMLATHPTALAWRREASETPEMSYRLLNAPLPKYVLGLGRRAAGVGPEAVAVDWSWSKSWADNRDAGALPGDRVLTFARTASALMLLPALAGLYLTGRRLGGRRTGLLAAGFLATNALVLLHGRRAMSEGTLILGVSLAAAGLVWIERRPWLAGVGAALAAAAKTSSFVWIPLGWLGLAWPLRSGPSLRTRLRRWAAFTAAAVAVVLLLHPVLWADPIGAAGAMWRARQDLVAAQVAMTNQVMPGTVLATPTERVAAMFSHLFFSPLQFAEASNYSDQTAASERAYQALPGRNLLRGWVGGAFFLTLTLFGGALALRHPRDREAARAAGRLALATLIQAGALVAFVPLSFQRYWIPLVPLVCLWAGHGVSGLAAVIRGSARSSPGTTDAK